MAWDEWEQLKKRAAERGKLDPDVRVTGGVGSNAEALESSGPAQEADPPDELQERETPERGESGTADLDAAQQMARTRHIVDGFRDTTVLVPLVPVDGGGPGLLATDFGGVRWIHAFTDELAAARFDEAQDGLKDRRDFMAVQGWRLLDVVVPAMGVPCGVALDVGSGDGGVLLPPVVGIVPDAAAVDAGVNGGGERSW